MQYLCNNTFENMVVLVSFKANLLLAIVAMQLWWNLFITAQKTLSVLLMSWEKERVEEESFGWKGDEVAKDMCLISCLKNLWCFPVVLFGYVRAAK